MSAGRTPPVLRGTFIKCTDILFATKTGGKLAKPDHAQDHMNLLSLGSMSLFIRPTYYIGMIVAFDVLDPIYTFAQR